MRWLRAALLISCLALAASNASAYVSQTITVDGNGADWNPANLVQDDSLDTQTQNWCTNDPENESPMDIGKVFITNDANFLYVGFFYDRDCFQSPQVNLGMAIDVNGAAGSTTDAFSRKISWANVPSKPDFYVYDVLDGFNFEVLYSWNGAAWATVQSGSNNLGIVENTTFIEFKLSLATLGLSAGNAINFDIWMTQDGTTKGPLDAVCDDTSQVSKPSGTLFDLAQPVTLDCMIPYTIIGAVDADPPTVVSAAAVGFPLNSNKTFGLNSNKVDVVFSEGVALASAQTPGNYALTGPINRTIIDATRDATFNNIVHLTLSGSINAQAGVYSLAVTGVNDLAPAPNTIVNNGTTNVGKFFIHNLIFNADVRVNLCRGLFATTDSFYVEGNLSPLSFDLADNAALFDANSDSIYTGTVPFVMPFNPDSGQGVADLQWKFGRRTVGGVTSEYEGGSNREYHVTSNSGSSETIVAYWNNDDPANFTFNPVDVIFQVDATAVPNAPDSVISLVGSTAPLSFTLPGLLMKDDGVAPDVTAGDKIYAVRVTFPACSPKNVEWKVGVNDRFECLGQGNKSVFLNDALFSTANPITLPARPIDFCTISSRAVTVVFKVNTVLPGTLPTDSVWVKGGVLPLDFAMPTPNLDGYMKDDGVGFDTGANDDIYTAAVTFPQGSNLGVNFKYAINSTYECEGLGDRFFTIDDLAYSTVSPQIRVVNAYNYCSDPTGVGDDPFAPARGAAFARLDPAYPNPATGPSTIGFSLVRGGDVSLRVYDIAGRAVRTLAGGPLASGRYRYAWDGRDDGGSPVTSGLYLVKLSMGRDKVVGRIILTR